MVCITVQFLMKMYANLYVDPDLGVDEPITLDNNRGTKDKPLATIGYALDQGTSGVRSNHSF